jgi:DNA-binding MarR family transcriptional regulator
MGSNISSPHARQVLDAIRRIVQALRESSRAAEKRAGLSSAQLFVLQTVGESPGLSLNELAERTRTHQSSVSAVVGRLARTRLIDRRTSQGDARRAEIRLSARGRTRLVRAPRAAQERLVATLDAMPRAERAQLAALLQRLVRAMALPKRRPSMFFEDSTKRKAGRRPHA